jgi:hypothetical protein
MSDDTAAQDLVVVEECAGHMTGESTGNCCGNESGKTVIISLLYDSLANLGCQQRQSCHERC